MKFKLTFRIPPGASEVKRHFDGVEYQYTKTGSAPARAEIKITALHEQQAFVIGHSIAKRNQWALSGRPVKVRY